MTMSLQSSEQIHTNLEKEPPHHQEVSDVQVTSLPIKPTMKRAFDVAFLISPDEKLKSRSRKTPVVHSMSYPVGSDDETILIDSKSNSPPANSYHKSYKPNSPQPDSSELMKYPSQSYRFANSPKVFDDPRAPQHFPEQKSAFTKVNLSSKLETRTGSATASSSSPSHSLSPELNYQNSLSPSPPIINAYIPKSFQNIPSNNFMKNSIPISPYSNSSFIEQNFPGPSSEANIFMGKHFDGNPHSQGHQQPIFFKNLHQNEIFSSGRLKQSVLNYRPDLPGYGGGPSGYSPIGAFQAAQPPSHPEMMKFSQGPSELLKIQTNPAAAILNSLLPPTFAALSLPAQNVCAKCNISFRMTSDLVYHMRSHHKNDVANDSLKKRREDKLKCPVCAESFRERHHLTRHMTAHQDKEGDMIDENNPASPAVVGVTNGNVTTSPGATTRTNLTDLGVGLGVPSHTGNNRKIRNINTNNAFNNVFCK